MGLRDSAIKVTGKSFDIERKIKGSPIRSIILLKRDGSTKPYAEIRTFTDGFRVGYTEVRNQSRIEIATPHNITNDLVNLFAIAVMTGKTGKIHAVSLADVAEPDDDRFTWLIYGSVRPNEVYEV